MARTRKDARINTRSARTSLQQRKEPYWRSISKGLAVGYYKGATSGAWIAKHFTVATGRRKASLGVADDFEDADGIRVLSFDQAQAKARDWASLKAQEDTGEVQSGGFTVAQAVDEYLAHLTKVKRKPQDRTRAIAKAHILPTLGDVELGKLRHGKIKAWRDSLAEAAPRVRTKAGKPQAYRTMDESQQRARQATANRILTVLKAALNYAKSESRRIASDAAWVDVKPFSKVDVPKVRFLTADEVTALMRACEPDFGHLVKGALVTGCRYGELTAMTVKDFAAKEGTVYIADSKNGESRYVQLNDEGIALFAELTHGRSGKDRIFVKANDTTWKKSEQKRPMDAACEAAKIAGVTFHILRHTYASHSVMNGMPIEVLAAQLGHKDTRITMRHYAHLSNDFKKQMIRANAPSFGFGNKPGPQLVTKAG
ncbi:tyrosine-type recombinase/integrase [Acidicapsa acidisoli]|uniref:tyrosine-type recombinase/integrase n=1 Tax=Acidicapsa acidisoli TaxID=1615681 RepID=UPI0021DFA679|nr:site-specific integrase [Acidicapsa acidisoli]